jgi:PDZ domain-containing protein
MLKNLGNFIKDNLLFFILLVLILVCTVIKVPYAVEMPGGTIDLSDRVTVNGDELDIDGSFNMAYVTMVDGSIPYVLIGLINPDWEVIPESDLTGENETMEDTTTRDRIFLEQSKNYAITAALEASGKEYKIVNDNYKIIYIDSKADTDIKIDDILLSYDGKKIDSLDKFKEYISTKNVGESIKLVVDRSGKEEEVTAKIYQSEDGNKYIGVSIVNLFDIESEYDIKIKSELSESGPSGGMMMALMIYCGITGEDLTGGKKIVGTGTIGENGVVGEIGGVKYKLMGAHKAKADVFLVPKDNYEEAIKVKKEKGYDISIVSVETLDDAIKYLNENHD